MRLIAFLLLSIRGSKQTRYARQALGCALSVLRCFLLLPRLLLLSGVFLLARSLLLLLTGLVSVLAWLSLTRVLLLLLLFLLAGVLLLVSLLRHVLNSFRLVNSKPGGLLWVHGHRVRKNPSVGEEAATLNCVS